MGPISVTFVFSDVMLFNDLLARSAPVSQVSEGDEGKEIRRSVPVTSSSGLLQEDDDDEDEIKDENGSQDVEEEEKEEEQVPSGTGTGRGGARTSNGIGKKKPRKQRRI